MGKVKQCIADSGVSDSMIQDIQTCWEGEEGIQLHHENGDKTDALIPPHKYVPWVTFNDEHSIDNESMYCHTICADVFVIIISLMSLSAKGILGTFAEDK